MIIKDIKLNPKPPMNVLLYWSNATFFGQNVASIDLRALKLDLIKYPIEYIYPILWVNRLNKAVQ